MKSIFYSLISKLGFALVKLAAKAKTRGKCDFGSTMNCETIGNLTLIYLVGKDEEVGANLMKLLKHHNGCGDDIARLIETKEEFEDD